MTKTMYVLMLTDDDGHRHDILGVFDTLDGAKSAAEKRMSDLEDDQCNVEVVELQLNSVFATERVVAKLERVDYVSGTKERYDKYDPKGSIQSDIYWVEEMDIRQYRQFN